MKDIEFQEILEKKSSIGNSIIREIETEEWNDNLIRNLDDYAPNLSWTGHQDFVLKKVEELISDSKFLRKGLYTRDVKNMFCSWKNDEWLGGLIYLYENTSSSKIERALNKFLDNFSQAFLKNDKICSFSFLINDKWYPYPSFSPRSGVILEGLAELNDEKFSVPDWELILKNSFDNKYFREKGIFPNETFFGRLSWFNLISDMFQIPFPGYYIRKMAPAKKVYQPTKPNSSMLHATITGYRHTNSDFLRSKVKKFIEGINRNFIDDEGFVVSPSNGNERKSLSSNHPFIDGLCDAYHFVEKNREWLQTAESIANTWKKKRLSTDLFPADHNQNFSWLDDQIDIAISFGRLYELTDKEEYLDIAKETIKSTFDKHYSESKKGLVEKVDKDGKVIDYLVHPKYNALAIKAFIFLEEVIQGDKKIYSEDPEIHEILKDR